MAKTDKVATVAEITDRFRSSNAAVITEYRGLTMAQLTELRRSLGSETSYTVAKNTLVRRAAADAGVAGLDELFTGPTAVAFIDGEPVDAAKALRDFARAHPLLVIKGGLLDGRPIEPAEVAKLADLESREVLLAKLAGAMKGTLTKAAVLFNQLPSQVVRLVAALQEQRAESGDANLGVTESVEAAAQAEASAADVSATGPGDPGSTDTAEPSSTDTAEPSSADTAEDSSADTAEPSSAEPTDGSSPDPSTTAAVDASA